MRDAKGLETIGGMDYLASAPKGEVIVDMVIKNKMLYVATDKHIYKLTDDKRLVKQREP